MTPTTWQHILPPLTEPYYYDVSHSYFDPNLQLPSHIHSPSRPFFRISVWVQVNNEFTTLPKILQNRFQAPRWRPTWSVHLILWYQPWIFSAYTPLPSVISSMSYIHSHIDYNIFSEHMITVEESLGSHYRHLCSCTWLHTQHHMVF